VAVVVAFVLSLLLVTPVSTSHDTATVSHSVTLRGADISWPNCPKGEGLPYRRTKGEPLPKRNAAFVVVGLTNGPGFYPNPCIADQLAWVRDHHRLLGGYALTTYPSAKQIRVHQFTGPYDGNHSSGRLRNAGYAEATYNVREMLALGMKVPMVWVDVEPYPTNPWSGSRRANRSIIRGVIRGYHDAGYPVGIYTYAYGWAQVVGSWQLPHLPTWTTAGPRGAKAARAMCSRGPSGGVTWLTQWYTTHRDFDATCPAAPGRRHLFH
jgi:hypothetical protein